MTDEIVSAGFMDVKEVLTYLKGIKKACVYELLAQGEIPHLRIGRRILVSRKGLEDFTRKNLHGKDLP